MANTDIQSTLERILIDAAQSKDIKNYDILPNITVNIGDGFISNFYTGEIQNKDIGETIFVAIKAPPTYMQEYSKHFSNEIIFYEKIFPALVALQKEFGITDVFDPIPKYFCGSLKPKEEYLALENVKPLNYVMHDKVEYLSQEQLEFIFTTYGKFHALSFVLKQTNLEKFKEITKDVFDFYPFIIQVLEEKLKESFAGAVSGLDSKKENEIKEKSQLLIGNIKEEFTKVARYEGEHNCITHGDCWSNNMMFHYKSTSSSTMDNMKLIDFQLIRISTPVHDLSYFFYSGASKTDLEKLDYYLELYHKSFSSFSKKLGVNPDDLFPLDILKKDWKQYGLFGVFMGIYLWQVKLMPKAKIEELMRSGNSCKEASMKRFFDLMSEMYQSEQFKERTKPIIVHAYDYGILK